jgi:hypothetical protein
MKKLIAVFTLAVTFTGCALLKERNATWKEDGVLCIRDDKAKDLLNTLEPTVDGLAAMNTAIKKTDETALTERLCSKRTFTRNGYRIVIFQRPSDPAHRLYSTISPPKNYEISPRECLARARKDLRDLGAGFGLQIMNLHDEKYKWISQDDGDIGPAKWLVCSKEKTAEYWSSLGNLIHELNHELSRRNCLVSAIGQDPMCLMFPQGLPAPAGARITQFKAANPEHLKKLNEIQDLYLNTLNQPINSIIDELNAYILTAKIQSLVLDHHGPLAIIDPANHSRYAELLPLFQVLIARYFTSLKVTHPELYNRTMNRERLGVFLRTIVDNAEATHNEWLATIKKHNIELYDFEKDLNEQYAKLKPAIFPKRYGHTSADPSH